MVMRGTPPATEAVRQFAARARVAEADADRLWLVVVTLRGQSVAEASPAGQAHLAAVNCRPGGPQ